jgi:hypothetical protein
VNATFQRGGERYPAAAAKPGSGIPPICEPAKPDRDAKPE